MTTEPRLTDIELARMQARCDAATPGPWLARVERREGFSGSDFIETSAQDIEMLGATEADYDFVAHARQDIPALLAEIERLRSKDRG
ncbi:MAG: hypothetical protein JSR86_01155 [Proteobacteria bacterium]|nr:hypothetical protein [Pseudomonadota bacterium]